MFSSVSISDRASEGRWPAHKKGTPIDTETLALSPDELLTTTRAVRRRLDLTRTVERPVITRCLEIAFQAPNGENTQSWAWMAVDDPEVRLKMADIYRAGVSDVMTETERARAEERPDPFARMGWSISESGSNERIMRSAMHLHEHFHEVPMLVVPVLRTRLEGLTLFESASVWGSVLPAAWSFLLALRSRGLGSVWTTAHLLRAPEMQDLLGLPEDTTQVGMFPVAYTIGTDFRPGQRDGVASALHWNHWAG